jgi:hypothetical protein
VNSLHQQQQEQPKFMLVAFYSRTNINSLKESGRP